MKNLFFTVLCLFVSVQKIVFAYPSNQVLQVSYCDEDRFNTQMPKTPNFMRSVRDKGVERGFMALYQHVLLDTMGTISIYGGGNIARWHSLDDQIVTGSAFLSGRLWVLHLLFIHPYVEYSMFGPTLTSKDSFGELNFKSNFLFQNFFGVGVEIGEKRGFSIDLKTIRYYESNDFTPHDGFRIPVIASFGVLF